MVFAAIWLHSVLVFLSLFSGFVKTALVFIFSLIQLSSNHTILLRTSETTHENNRLFASAAWK